MRFGARHFSVEGGADLDTCGFPCHLPPPPACMRWWLWGLSPHPWLRETNMLFKCAPRCSLKTCPYANLQELRADPWLRDQALQHATRIGRPELVDFSRYDSVAHRGVDKRPPRDSPAEGRYMGYQTWCRRCMGTVYGRWGTGVGSGVRNLLSSGAVGALCHAPMPAVTLE